MEDQKENFVLIPPEHLSTDLLSAVAEEFILREGTDYGRGELELEEKKRRLLTQVAGGKVVVVFSTLTENTTFMTKSDFQKISLQIK